MFKDAAVERLRCNMHTTNYYKNVKRRLCAFYRLRTAILSQLNKFINDKLKYSDGT